MAKVLPRFSFAFALLPYSKWGISHERIQKTIGRALNNVCGWRTPKILSLPPGIWLAVCGFPPVLWYLRMLKIKLGTRLKLADHKAGQIFR